MGCGCARCIRRHPNPDRSSPWSRLGRESAALSGLHRRRDGRLCQLRRNQGIPGSARSTSRSGKARLGRESRGRGQCPAGRGAAVSTSGWKLAILCAHVRLARTEPATRQRKLARASTQSGVGRRGNRGLGRVHRCRAIRPPVAAPVVAPANKSHRTRARNRLTRAGAIIIALDFRLCDRHERENSLAKADLLVDAITAFRDALRIEADLVAGREAQRKESAT